MVNFLYHPTKMMTYLAVSGITTFGGVMLQSRVQLFFEVNILVEQAFEFGLKFSDGPFELS